jgi:hypothetical protein
VAAVPEALLGINRGRDFGRLFEASSDVTAQKQKVNPHRRQPYSSQFPKRQQGVCLDQSLRAYPLCH